MLHRDVAEGVHRISEHYVNWYLVEEGGRITIVDAGLPASWQSLLEALNKIGRSPGDVEALVLTHAHFDHIGFAERARAELGIPVYVHENDVPLTRHPLQYSHERPRSWYFATQAQALPLVASAARNRALRPAAAAPARPAAPRLVGLRHAGERAADRRGARAQPRLLAAARRRRPPLLQRLAR